MLLHVCHERFLRGMERGKHLMTVSCVFFGDTGLGFAMVYKTLSHGPIVEQN